MIDINLIRENPEKVKKLLAGKGVGVEAVDRLLKVDETRRQLIAEVEKWRQERNRAGPKNREKGKKIKEILRRLEPDLKAVEQQWQNLLEQLPNLPADDVPAGKNENDNVEIKKHGQPKKFTFKPKSHYELGKALDVIDTKRAAKVSGTRFGYLKNEAVLLQIALVYLAFEVLLKEGFKPVIPPVMISLEAMKKMGYLEGEEKNERYILEKDKLVLVGTSEQAIGPMHQDEVLAGKDLPLRYVGFSTCFRREAGSYGQDTKGILRVHQFNKVEMFSYCRPKNSKKEHEFLLSMEEKLMQALKLPYRALQICTGDLGTPAARKYDIEAWFPSEKRYRETHSTSNCTDFQARRLNIKYQKKDGQLELVHTLNGTAFSERPILAILENFQQKDGSVLVPQILQKWTGFKKISAKK